MLKKEIKYTDFYNGDEIKQTETVRFVYTLKTLKMYETETNLVFFDEYSKALEEFSKLIGNEELKKAIKETSEKEDDSAENNNEKMLAFLPLVANPIINKFMLDVIPCLYAESDGNILIQSEETHDNCSNSIWFMQLVNVEFFVEVMEELTANQTKAPNRQTKKKTVISSQ